MLRAYAGTLEKRSRAVAGFLSQHIPSIAIAWLCIFGLVAWFRLETRVVPIHNWGDLWPMALPYLLIVLAPIAGFLIASGSYPAGRKAPRTAFSFAIYGRWRAATRAELRTSPVHGPAGFLASLLIGLLLNVVVRSFEFVAAMPALNGHAPAWGQALFLVMAADVVVMNFFYTVCFVMALRSVPLFPRMLLFVWMLDILAQLVIAHQLAAMPGVPAMVAQPLGTLLDGNITKVLISAFVWLPYLILSDRVNLTYRRRVRVRADAPRVMLP